MLVQHMAGSGVAQDAARLDASFFDVNVRLSYDLRVYKEITLQLYGGVQNLFNAYQKDFDKGADRDSGYIYGPSLPRSWFVGAKVSFWSPALLRPETKNAALCGPFRMR